MGWHHLNGKATCTLCGWEGTYTGDFPGDIPHECGKTIKPIWNAQVGWVYPHGVQAGPNAIPCIHLGEDLRLQQCESCGGNIQLKVFACDIYKECTLGKKLEGLQCCAMCKDYFPKS